MCICCTACALLFFYFFYLNAGLLARSQYSEGPATGHLDTGFSWFPYAYKQMLRWFPRFQAATTCFSYSPPDLNLVVTNFMSCLHVYNPIAVNKYKNTTDHDFWVKVHGRKSWGLSNWINVTLTGKGILLYGLVRVSFKGGFKSSVGEFRSLSKLKPNVRMCLAASAHHLLTSWRLSCATTFGLSLTIEVASCRKWFWWRGQELRVEAAVWTFPDERFPRWVTRRRMEAWVGAPIRSNSNRLLFGLANIGLSEVGCCCISGFFRCWRPLWDFLLSLETPDSPNRPRDSAMLIMYLAFSLTISCTVDILHVKAFGQT